MRWMWHEERVILQDQPVLIIMLPKERGSTEYGRCELVNKGQKGLRRGEKQLFEATTSGL